MCNTFYCVFVWFYVHVLIFSCLYIWVCVCLNFLCVFLWVLFSRCLLLNCNWHVIDIIDIEGGPKHAHTKKHTHGWKLTQSSASCGKQYVSGTRCAEKTKGVGVSVMGKIDSTPLYVVVLVCQSTYI